MRKNIFRAAVAALVMFSACETLQPQKDNEVFPESDKPSGADVITATIGTDTKTYLEWDFDKEVYKTRWSEGDYIWLIEDRPDTLIYQTCHMIDGAGTSSATFAANRTAESYYAVYSYNANYANGVIGVSIPYYQKHYSVEGFESQTFVNHAYPMVAKSSTKDFQFENLCSVLKIDVTGNGEFLQKIRVYSNDGKESISGNGKVDFGGDKPTLLMLPRDGYNVYDYVDYIVEETLSSEPIDCYIVLPAQVYEAGFTVELHTDAGIMDLTTGADIVLEQSKIHSIPVINFEREKVDWYVHDYSGSKYKMTFERGMYVLRNAHLNQGAFYFENENGDYYLWDAKTYGHGIYFPTNTQVKLVPYNDEDKNYWCQALVEGSWDIYLDPDNAVAYLLESGYDLDNIPTREHVFYSTYNSLWDVEDGEKIMTSGCVLATYSRGFILGMCWDINNTILVYLGPDSEWMPSLGSFVDIYSTKSTYRGLPELKDVEWHYTIYDDGYDYGNVSNYCNLVSPDEFLAYQGNRYDPVKYIGKLTKEGNRYYIDVDGVEGRRASLEYPDVDLTEYVGKQVMIEGFFIGFDTQFEDEVLCTVFKYITEVETSDGATEDFIPGDDIVMSRSNKNGMIIK